LAGKKKKRLDKILVENGMAPTLHLAGPLIMAGKVIVDDHMVDKPGTLVSPQSYIRLRNLPPPYASRGGEKLEKPLETFSISVTDRTVIDVGASTGGFTDCLLQNGASLVFAVDVGYGQLTWKLQKDKRVVSLDRTNITTLNPEDLRPQPDLAVVDVSFTSLKKILPHVTGLLTPDGETLCLVKPQFEVKKGSVEKGGIVRDIKQYQKVIQDLVIAARKLSLKVIGIMESPIQGQKGNREFFMYAKKC
jgi:23S rRNA (cytidine1920-2'-O)/16S rRNA (cytidine1409-2'-O)-methyltransferase